MQFRLARSDDLRIARDLVPPAYRYSSTMREELPAIWASLLRSGQMTPVVVEDPGLPAGEWVRGVGLSVFVTDDFADTALRTPQPFLNARLHEMICAGRSPILTRRQIAEANTNGGLTLMPLHFATRSFDISDPAVVRTLIAAQDLFRIMHAGCRIKRMVKEVVHAGLCQVMQSTGMRLVTDYQEVADAVRNLPPEERPFLLAFDHADLAFGSAMSLVFTTGDVRFQFSPAEQKQLQCALLYENDEDIATDLGLSLDTLHTHWRSIHRRVLSVDPECYPEDRDNGGRGRGKRGRLLRYLNMNMQGLRPHGGIKLAPQAGLRGGSPGPRRGGRVTRGRDRGALAP
jgi:hypothetical protein